jgi:proton-coupled amino acid transporter
MSSDYAALLPDAGAAASDGIDALPKIVAFEEGGLSDEDDDGHGGGGGGSGAAAASAPAESASVEQVRLVATIVKAFIGSGVLFLPKAFSNGGWAASAGVMLLMAAITQVTIVRLVACRGLVRGSYAAIGGAACGPWAALSVDAALVLSQAGFCCVYIAFIARNALQLLNVGACAPQPRVGGGWLWALILAQAALFIPLSWIRSMRTLGWTSAAANAIIACGLAGILAWAGAAWAAAPPRPGGFAAPAYNAAGFPLFLGTAVYAYEGIGMVVPIYDSLSPGGQRGFARTLSGTLAGIVAVYLVVGMLPYLYLVGAAGEGVGDAITLSLPSVWWAYAIMAGYCIALCLTYPLMLYPVLRIAERACAGLLRLREGAPAARSCKRNALRSAVVATTLAVAYAGAPQLDNLVALVGCFACTPLAFVFPALFHARLVPRTAYYNVTNAAIIALGIGVFFFSTYEAIATWSSSPINPCPHAGS